MTITLPRPYAYHSLADNEYLGVHDRRAVFAAYTEGVLGPGELAVTATSPASLEVNIAAGRCLIQGDAVPRQGLYYAELAEAQTIALPAAPGGLPRIDRLVVHDRDSSPDGGSSANDDQRIYFVQGAPSGLPSPPATPGSAIPLADVYVPASASSITAGNITDARPFARIAETAIAPGAIDTAQIADGAVTGAKLAATDVHTVSSFGTGWSSPTYTARAHRDPSGRVTLSGSVQAAGSPSGVVFTLPVGWRPVMSGWYVVPLFGAGTPAAPNAAAIVVQMGASGQLTVTASAGWSFSLAGITYQAA